MRGRFLALVAWVFASVLMHYAASPWALLPTRGFDMKDQEGELAIPVDLIEEKAPEPPPPPPPPAVPDPPKTSAAEGPGGHADASAPKKRDAGKPLADLDAEAESDAESDADLDAARDGGVDGGEDGGEGDAAREAAIADASGDGSSDADLASDALLAANAEAGVTGTGSRDPSALLGGAGSGVMAGAQNIQVVLNMAVIKSNPVGARLGPLLAAAPQWRDFLVSTGIDPVRDGDWFMLFGPSLVNTERDVAVVHFNVSDARAAKAMETLAKRDVGGGAFDAGVPNVKAWRGRADRAARVFMLPRPHLAVISPPDFAHTAAAAFARAAFTPKLTPGEAVRAKFKEPHGSVGEIPESISELRLWAVPTAEGGAELFVEGDCPDASSASEAASVFRRAVRARNSLIVQAVTHGVLNTAEFRGEGRTMRGHLTVTAEQLETLYELAAGYLNVPVDRPGSAAPASPPAASPH